MKNNKHFLVPMIISMVLLPLFLAYFLRSEFESEKANIELEQKDDAINNFFAQLDTVSTNSKEGKGGLVSWMKNDSGANVSFKLHITERNDNDSLNRFPVKLKFDSIKTDTVITVFSELTTVKKEDSTNENWLTRKSSAHPSHTMDSAYNEHLLSPGHQNKSLEIFKFEGNQDKPVFGILQDVINPLDVLARMLPQILFSLFLLASVFLAYWFIFRSLRNERHLAIIRNDFMSNMSHELKTPVSTIGVALEALSSFDAADNPALRKEYIDISKHEVERLGLLVDKALNISLYEQGKFVYDRQNIDLNQEIEKVLKTLKVQLDNQHVELHYESKGNDFNVHVDRTHMINVVYNLIENGIKYSENNAEIDIRLIERSDDLELSISDKGRGIAPEFQDRVFEKFFRVPQGHTHNVKGHGLGLSYVKEVVESMGGRISLKSGVDAGSTFIIKIPKAHG